MAQVCRDYGQRAQKSELECKVNKMKFEVLRGKRLRKISKEEDILPLYGSRDRGEHVETYGLSRTEIFGRAVDRIPRKCW